MDELHWRFRWRAEATLNLKKAGFSVTEFESMELWLVAKFSGADKVTTADEWEMTDADRARMEKFGQASEPDLTSSVMRQMGINTG